MEVKIDLEKLICQLIENACISTNRVNKYAITEALKDQGIEYKDGSLHYIGEEEKKPATIKFEPEKPIQSEVQEDQVEIFYCTPPEKFPPLLKAEHYMLLYKDFERLLGMIHKKVSSLPEHKVDAYFSWLQTELSKRVKHHQEEARLLEDFHSFYRVPKPEI